MISHASLRDRWHSYPHFKDEMLRLWKVQVLWWMWTLIRVTSSATPLQHWGEGPVGGRKKIHENPFYTSTASTNLLYVVMTADYIYTTLWTQSKCVSNCFLSRVHNRQQPLPSLRASRVEEELEWKERWILTICGSLVFRKIYKSIWPRELTAWGLGKSHEEHRQHKEPWSWSLISFLVH